MQQLTQQVEDLQLQVEMLQSEQQPHSLEPPAMARAAAQEALPSQPVRVVLTCQNDRPTHSSRC